MRGNKLMNVTCIFFSVLHRTNKQKLPLQKQTKNGYILAVCQALNKRANTHCTEFYEGKE